MPFKIKICGITNVSDAKRVQESGADAIGLNFYSKSLRSVTLDKASKISSAISDLIVVGVFVNEPADSINRIADTVGLDYAQLHGDESPGILAEIKIKTLRAIRVMNGNFDSALMEASAWSDAGSNAILLDAGSRAEYGGTGQHLDWKKVADFSIHKPLILAGGLNCDNVAQAIRIANPFGVDVASGIEKFPGSKDPDLMQSFVNAALAAY